MLRVFNVIRQRLLNEGRFNRYLVYALGEIVLLVAGILIALAVNNWNEERKDLLAEQDLLIRIQRDLQQDIAQFQRTIEANEALREEIKGFLNMLYANVDSIEQAKEMATVYDSALDQVFEPNDNTYRSILSSGTLGLIKNPDLKDEIIDLYNEYEQTKSLLDSINRWMEGIATALDIETEFMKFNEFIIDIYSSEAMLNESDLAFLNNPEDPRFQILERAISATAFNQKVRSSYYQALIPRCESLISRIEAEISKTN